MHGDRLAGMQVTLKQDAGQAVCTARELAVGEGTIRARDRHCIREAVTERREIFGP